MYKKVSFIIVLLALPVLLFAGGNKPAPEAEEAAGGRNRRQRPYPWRSRTSPEEP